jgi:cytoskeletal protein RodZ
MFEIGNTLREARLRRGFDVARCEAETKIRAKYLRAMEEDQFDVLPAPTYVRGFLRAYSEFLGLDWQLVLDEYESRFGGFADPHWEGDHAGSPPPRPRRGMEPERRSPETRLLWIAIVGVLCIALLVWVGAGSPEDAQTQPSATGGGETTTTGQQAVPRIVARLTGVGRGTGIVVRSRDASGKRIFEDRIEAGQSQRYSFRQSIWLQIDDPSGVEVTVDGVPRAVPRAGPYLVTRQGLQSLSVP